MSKEKNSVVKVAELFLIGVLAVTVCGLLVQQLWNWLMPTIFGLPAVTFWQGLGLVALSWILFGFPGSRNGRGRRRMTHEQRERFRKGLEDRSSTQRRRDAEEEEEEMERGV